MATTKAVNAPMMTLRGSSVNRIPGMASWYRAPTMAFVLLDKVSSPALRARTTVSATATQAIFGIVMFFAVLYVAGPDADKLEGKAGFAFGRLSLLATIAALFYIPELKGRTCSQIDHIFKSRVPPRKKRSDQLSY